MPHRLEKVLGDGVVVLASGSPRRKDILENQLGVKNFRVIASQFPEDLNKNDYAPFEYVVQTAIRKALDVYQSEADSDEPPALVLAADTVVVSDGIILEKPRGVDHHVQMLQRLRDSKHPHKVFTGVIAIVPFEKPVVPGYAMESYLGESTVRLRPDITDEEIIEYVKTQEGSDAAGGYKIQEDGGRKLIKSYQGEISNIAGLPVEGTIKLIEKTFKCAQDLDSESEDEDIMRF